ncbi:MAG: ribonuclease P protein component [Candidatus Omnitrophica bacterium]|nr:ribonuclease P protein component [Candidatus Omnitrophota bacterium]
MKIKHILRPKDFAEVLENGEKYGAGPLLAYVERIRMRGLPEIGIIVSKKVAPKAVTRNYLRRIIYSYFRGEQPGWIKGARIIVRVASKVDSLGKRSLSEQIRHSLDQIVRKMR